MDSAHKEIVLRADCQAPWRWRSSLSRFVRVLARLFLMVVFALLVAWNVFLVYELATALHLNDFGRFHYSAVAFFQGQDMYGPRPAAVAQTTELHGQQFGNMNPPHFHLLVLPLALLPPRLALAFWGVVSLLGLFASLRVIVREVEIELTPQRCWAVTVGLLSFVGTGMVLVTGQLSFLLLLPITLAWVEARQGRWTTAGGYLGLAMGVKPFLLIFMPYLMLRRQLQAAVVASVTALLCFALGLLVFGIDAHWSWLRELAAIHWVWANTNTSVLGFLTRILSESPHFSPLVSVPTLIRPLWFIVAGLIGLLTLAVSTADSTKAAVDRGFALLLLASLLISPLGWVYYHWLPLGPLVALFSSWWLNHKQERTNITSWKSRWRTNLTLAALPGLVCPFFATRLFQPHPWATVSIGSVYFWTTLALWASLLLDWCTAEEYALISTQRGSNDSE